MSWKLDTNTAEPRSSEHIQKNASWTFERQKQKHYKSQQTPGPEDKIGDPTPETKIELEPFTGYYAFNYPPLLDELEEGQLELTWKISLDADASSLSDVIKTGTCTYQADPEHQAFALSDEDVLEDATDEVGDRWEKVYLQIEHEGRRLLIRSCNFLAKEVDISSLFHFREEVFYRPEDVGGLTEHYAEGLDLPMDNLWPPVREGDEDRRQTYLHLFM